MNRFHDLRTLDRWLSVIGAALLAGYFVIAMYALSSPSNDPQRGMAEGFIILVGLVLLVLAGALWFGVARGRLWVIRVVFAVAVFPALSQIAQWVYLAAHRAP